MEGDAEKTVSSVLGQLVRGGGGAVGTGGGGGLDSARLSSVEEVEVEEGEV